MEVPATVLNAVHHIAPAQQAVVPPTGATWRSISGLTFGCWTARQLAATRATPEMIDELAELLTRMRKFEHHQAEYTAADVGFHIAVARASGNPLFPVLLRPLVTMIVEGIFESHGTDRATEGGIAGHTRVLNAIRRRQPTAAGRAMAEHLAESRAVFPEEVAAPRNRVPSSRLNGGSGYGTTSEVDVTWATVEVGATCRPVRAAGQTPDLPSRRRQLAVSAHHAAAAAARCRSCSSLEKL
jgi:hypothetical protein